MYISSFDGILISKPIRICGKRENNMHERGRKVVDFFFMHFFLCIFFSGTKHPREDNPNLYYWAEITGLHTQTFNI